MEAGYGFEPLKNPCFYLAITIKKSKKLRNKDGSFGYSKEGSRGESLIVASNKNWLEGEFFFAGSFGVRH
ncbi:MAG TPA: hypothetical protein PKA28_16995 [Methylomusa anaerophila]|nr:hypothetical protein [Methylomusa anaerophila]HML90139.1 hypothetical protein [Methylomusa anaerophila]